MLIFQWRRGGVDEAAPNAPKATSASSPRPLIVEGVAGGGARPDLSACIHLVR